MIYDKSKIHIFAVDNDILDLELLKKTVQKTTAFNIDLHCFKDWGDCRNLYFNSSADILFLDYKSGIPSSKGVIEEIRKNNDNRPIVILTNKENGKITTEFLKAGANDYLLKNDLSPEVLRITISNLIEKNKLLQEKELLEQELHESQKMDTIGILTSGIAHDLNNFLTSIVGLSEISMVSSDINEIRSKQRKLLGICDNMSEIIRQLMNFSRKDNRKLEKMTINNVLADTINILAHSLPHGIKIEHKIASRLPPVICSISLFHQIILNICINAAESMNNKGSLKICCSNYKVKKIKHLILELLQPGSYVSIRISDTGKGIKKENMDHIFEPFFTTKQQGTGLGLAMVWSNVKKINGHIDVISHPGKGSSFFLYFPSVGK